MRIAICEFHQESNSFNKVTSKIDDYSVFGIWNPEEMIEKGRGCSALGGMIESIENAGAEIVPTWRMWANAAGPVEDSIVQNFTADVTAILKDALPLDGVCVSMHGATQSTASDDVCGDILESIRAVVGETSVISASFDLHANITEKIQKNADFISGYHTYPHVDFYETGVRAAKLCIGKIKKEEPRLVTTRVTVPMMFPASAYTTITGPIADLMADAEAMVKDGRIADFSIFQMQPWLDVVEGGSSVIIISDKPEQALGFALARKLMELRHKIHVELESVDDIVAEAEENNSCRPIVLADSSDSTNAGALGESAQVLKAIIDRKSDVKAAMFLSDRESAAQAFEVGVGNTAHFSLGGKINPELMESVEVDARVCSLHDGIYTQQGPAKPGLVNHLGPAAVLQYRNTKILVTNYLLGPGDLQIFRHHGIEPTMYQLVSVKACTSFRVSYLPIAERIAEADTCGAAAVNLLRLPFKRLPKPFYPYTEISEDDIKITPPLM